MVAEICDRGSVGESEARRLDWLLSRQKSGPHAGVRVGRWSIDPVHHGQAGIGRDLRGRGLAVLPGTPGAAGLVKEDCIGPEIR